MKHHGKELTHKWVDLEVTHYMQQHEIVTITKKQITKTFICNKKT